MTPDPYASAKANLRDNVKTLITMFGGVTAVLLAGAPFSKYAEAKPFSLGWSAATAALVLALVLLTWAMRVLLSILSPVLSNLRMLTDQPTDREMAEVQKQFAKGQQDLLPKASDPTGRQFKTVDDLLKEKSEAWQQYIGLLNTTEDENGRAFAAYFKENYDRLEENGDIIKHWIGFVRLHWRVTRGVEQVIKIGLGAIVMIAIFLFASSAPEAEKTTAPAVYVVTPSSASPPQPPASRLPVLAPVLFATGEDYLTKESLKRVGAARDYLRAHAGVGVLIFANTDTVGGEKVNEQLAVRRADKVASLLRSEGGISASRIFVTPLAKKDLPALTGQKTESESNRSVEMVLIPLPVRGF